MTFQDPGWFLALVPLAVIGWLALRRQHPGLSIPTVERLPATPVHPWSAERMPLLLRGLACLLIVAALARPRQGLEASRLRSEGIDIVLLVDVSGSMLAEDFTLNGERRNRLDVIKSVVREFVDHRPNDRIGLVVFAGRPYTACPLTLDHGWLLAQLDRARINMVEDGTAIGSGIATGLNRLRHSRAKSRVMILLTDGVNNAGMVTPAVAAQAARTLGVRLYTIGAGTKGPVPFPATDVFGRKVYQEVTIDVDDAGLTAIAEATGGL